MLMSAGLRPKPKRLRVGLALTSWKSWRAVLSESSMLARSVDQVVVHPHARDVVAAARELHAVMIAVGAVQAAQELNRALRLVVDDARDGEQRGAELHFEQRRAGWVGQLGGHGLLRTRDLHAGLLQE